MCYILSTKCFSFTSQQLRPGRDNPFETESQYFDLLPDLADTIGEGPELALENPNNGSGAACTFLCGSERISHFGGDVC